MTMPVLSKNLCLLAEPPAVAGGFYRNLVARPKYFNKPLQAVLQRPCVRLRLRSLQQNAKGEAVRVQVNANMTFHLLRFLYSFLDESPLASAPPATVPCQGKGKGSRVVLSVFLAERRITSNCPGATTITRATCADTHSRNHAGVAAGLHRKLVVRPQRCKKTLKTAILQPQCLHPFRLALL